MQGLFIKTRNAENGHFCSFIFVLIARRTAQKRTAPRGGRGGRQKIQAVPAGKNSMLPRTKADAR